MISSLSSLILFAAITLGGVTYQLRTARSEAVITYSNGCTAEVLVVNHGDNFCPVDCRARHKHRVHDVRWTCTHGEGCRHYAVLHVSVRRSESEADALQRELAKSNPLPATADADVLAAGYEPAP
jgi:UDP-2,3-diacylglucosamine pyrophosphatase LpxH